MATINITIQSLLKAATFDAYSTSDANTVTQLKNQIAAATGVDVTWFGLVFNDHLLSNTDVLSVVGIVEGSVLRVANQIARLPTKQAKQHAKLELSLLDRTASGNPRSTYDITELPTQYSGDTVVDNPNVGGLQEGRPWN